MKKLKEVKKKLKVWNKREFGNVNNIIMELENQLHQIDLLSETRQLDVEEKKERKLKKEEFWKYSRLVESVWRQKSRINWIKLGDRNTRFFQITANNSYRKNMIDSIKVGGRVIEEPELIKAAAVNYFRTCFVEEVKDRSKLGGGFL